MTDEEIISRCYEHGQPDYVMAADAIKRLISERDEARMLADNKIGWRRWLPVEEALPTETPYLIYRGGENVPPRRKYAVDWLNDAGIWWNTRPAEQPTYWQELRPPIKAAPMVKRSTPG